MDAKYLVHGELDPERCQEAVPDFTGFHWFQCNNRKKYGDLCGVHENKRKRLEEIRKEFE